MTTESRSQRHRLFGGSLKDSDEYRRNRPPYPKKPASQRHYRRAWIVAGLALGMAAPAVLPATALAAQNEEQNQTAPATVPSLKTVEEYDTLIRKLGDTREVSDKIGNGTLDQNGKLLLMQRYLVNSAKYSELAAWANASEDNATFLQWLLTEPQMLELYVTGGKPGGLNGGGNASHVRSISQLMDIARKYKDDITAPNIEDRDVYRKMMVSAALGMNDSTRLWTGTNPKADPATRYGMIKTLRANHTQYHFKKEIFDKLPVDQMRWIFENRLADQEIPWLANYSNWFVGHDDDTRTVKSNGTVRPMTEQEKENERLNAYTFTEYSWFVGNYNDPAFYDKNQLTNEAIGIEQHGDEGGYDRQVYKKGQKISGGWQQKYRFKYEDKNFPGQELIPSSEISKDNSQLWMAFEKGGVCGAIAKTAENVSGVSGLPATVCGQPGHAACLRYEPVNVKTSDGKTETKMGYTVQNDVFGWLVTNTPEVNHKLCGWEEVHQQKNNDETTKRYGGGSFVLLAQDALDDWDRYVTSFLLRTLADASTSENKMTAIDAAIQQQPINLDATVAKIDLLAKGQATTQQWIDLAKQVTERYAYYPLPMHSLMKLIEQKGGNDVIATVETIRIDALNKATSATEDNVDQADVCRTVANGLLQKSDSKVVLFSFDGEDAGVLKLGPQFNNSSLEWEYSLDGGENYKAVTGNVHEVALSEEEIKSITAENDIKVKLRGVSSVNTIDITEGKMPEGYCVNDPERCVYLRDGKSFDSVEVKYDGSWHKLVKGQPLPENQDLVLRSAAQGTSLASVGDKTVTLPRFSKAWDPEDAKVVHAAELKINDASPIYGSSGAHRAINGCYRDGGEIWESSTSGEHYLVIDLGKTRALKHMDIIARGFGGGGNLFKIEISTAQEGAATIPPAEGDKGDPKVDPSAFDEVGDFDINWDKADIMRHRISFQKPVTARYLRIKSLSSKGSTASAREFIFYEDPKATPPAPQPQHRTLTLSTTAVAPTSITLKATPSAGENEGTLEYALLDTDREPKDTDWKASGEFSNLTPGTTYYAHARISGTSSFAAAQSEKLAVSTPAVQNGIEASVDAFRDLVVGYTNSDIAPATLTIANKGEVSSTVTVKLTDQQGDSAFDLTGADKPLVIAPGNTDKRITIAPKAGLAVGEHAATLQLACEFAGKTETISLDLKVRVTRVARSIQVEAKEIESARVELAATVSAGSDDGSIEYALVEHGMGAPAEKDWQTSPVFENLQPQTSYDAYARVRNGATHGDAVSEALLVETAAQPSPNPNPNPNPGPGPNPDPSPNPDPEPGPNPDPQPEPEPNPNPQPDPEPGPQPQPGPGQHGKPQDNGSANKLPATGDPALAATMATGIGGAIATLAGIVRNRRKREH